MSNYPPGVTGREYAIAGPDWEGTIEKECQADGTSFLVLGKVEADDFERIAVQLDMLHRRLYCEPGDHVALEELEMLRRYVQNVKRGIYEAQDEVCPFAGEVDAETYQGALSWTCPLCGTEHTEDLDTGPDPDYQRDVEIERRMDGEI